MAMTSTSNQRTSSISLALAGAIDLDNWAVFALTGTS
jgi:hypothetical protein